MDLDKVNRKFPIMKKHLLKVVTFKADSSVPWPHTTLNTPELKESLRLVEEKLDPSTPPLSSGIKRIIKEVNNNSTLSHWQIPDLDKLPENEDLGQFFTRTMRQLMLTDLADTEIRMVRFPNDPTKKEPANLFFQHLWKQYSELGIFISNIEVIYDEFS